MPECQDFKKADLVSCYKYDFEYLFYTVSTFMPKQTAKVAVSGGKKIKACGRTYFVADSTVRFIRNFKD
jgi:hypothetical protein